MVQVFLDAEDCEAENIHTHLESRLDKGHVGVGNLQRFPNLIAFKPEAVILVLIRGIVVDCVEAPLRGAKIWQDEKNDCGGIHDDTYCESLALRVYLEILLLGHRFQLLIKKELFMRLEHIGLQIFATACGPGADLRHDIIDRFTMVLIASNGAYMAIAAIISQILIFFLFVQDGELAYEGSPTIVDWARHGLLLRACSHTMIVHADCPRASHRCSCCLYERLLELLLIPIFRCFLIVCFYLFSAGNKRV